MVSLTSFQKDFTGLVKEGKLAHGYLFFGEDQTLGLDFAWQLANFLENHSWATPSAPGLIDVLAVGGGIDEVRSGINFLWRRPIKSARRTLIIAEADALTDEAQNAILKTAEEAPVSGLIILLTRNRDTLLPTLLSRFQHIFLGNIADHQSYYSAVTQKLVKRFLSGDITKRRQIIKDILEIDDANHWRDFITGLLIELNQDKLKNWRVIKELLRRWTVMNQYNTNKRLQLEAALANY